MKKIIILALFALLSLGAKAQFSISYSAGYGNYKMGDMKSIMKQSISAIPIEGMKLVKNFPAYVTHTVDVGYQIQTHEFGVRFSYLTTGSKIAMADWSGKYNEKLIANGYRLGISYRNYFYTAQFGQHSLSPFVELSPAATFSNLKSKGELKISEELGGEVQQSQDEQIDFDTTAFSAQLMAGARLKLYNHFLITLSGGYDFSFAGKLEQSNFRIDWSGIRLQAGVGYQF